MTIDELKHFRTMKMEIDHLSQGIERLRADGAKRKWPDGQPHGNHIADRSGEIGAETADLSVELEQRLAELHRCRLRIERSIRRFPPNDRLLIRLRYIEGLGWNEVAEKLGFSWRWTMELHRKLVAKLDNSSA